MQAQRLTIITINPVLEVAVKREIRVTGEINNQWRYHVKGSNRKEYFLTVDDGLIVLRGWGLPITLDHEQCNYGPKGGYNFLTAAPGHLRILLNDNINAKFDKWDKCKYRRPYEKRWLDLFEHATV